MIVAVTGGRDFQNQDLLFDTLDNIYSENAIDCIVHGGASGADSLADKWAMIAGIQPVKFKALWNIYGKSAGPRRNHMMLSIMKPDMLVAFPGGKGTAYCVEIARRMCVNVMEIKE